jgi:hypothetical protein
MAMAMAMAMNKKKLAGKQTSRRGRGEVENKRPKRRMWAVDLAGHWTGEMRPA